jgi:predicted transcriptional regulator YheO
LYEKSIIFKLIFELGCPVFVIAKRLGTSEVEVYRYLNGEKMSREVEVKLKKLWLDLVKLDS